jgi:hypothetical protein
MNFCAWLRGARPSLVDLNRLSDQEIEDLERQLIEWRKKLRPIRVDRETSRKHSPRRASRHQSTSRTTIVLVKFFVTEAARFLNGEI